MPTRQPVRMFPDVPPAAPPRVAPGRSRFAVVGFGNVFQGDRGVGLYALEAMEQAGFGREATLDFLTGDYRSLMFCLHEADAAVIIQAALMSGRPGELHALDLPRFRSLAATDHRVPSRHRALAETLAWIEVAHRLPRGMLFLFVEPDPTRDREGPGLSGPARRGVRRAVELAADFLEKHGAGRPAGHVQDRLYAIPWLGVTF